MEHDTLFDTSATPPESRRTRLLSSIALSGPLSKNWVVGGEADPLSLWKLLKAYGQCLHEPPKVAELFKWIASAQPRYGTRYVGDGIILLQERAS